MASIVRCNLFQRDPRSGRTVNSYQFPTNPFEPLQVFSPPIFAVSGSWLLPVGGQLTWILGTSFRNPQ